MIYKANRVYSSAKTWTTSGQDKPSTKLTAVATLSRSRRALTRSGSTPGINETQNGTTPAYHKPEANAHYPTTNP